HMRAERLDHAQLAAQFLADYADPGGIHRLVRYPSGKEPVLGLAPTPVDTEQLQQLGREHDLAWEVPLTGANVNDHAWAVDVGDLQIQGFLAAQPGAVESGQQSAMLQVQRAIEQGADFFPAPDYGQ